MKDEYPRVEAAPLLPTEYETFGDSQSGNPEALTFLDAKQIPRTWFIAESDAFLVQLQSNRLLLNWRRGDRQSEYPHFDAMTARFRAVYETFEAFAVGNGLGDLKPDQCEMTYINVIPLVWPNEQKRSVADVLNLWDSSFSAKEWSGTFEDVSIGARHIIRNEVGAPYARLTIRGGTGQADGQSGLRVLQLEISVRGAPASASLEGVASFHAMAHEQIVRCFAAVTTEKLHIEWGRENDV